MKPYVPMVRRLRFVHLLLAVLINLVVFAPRAIAAEPQRPTAHERAAIAAEQGLRQWYHEEEFRRDYRLRARPEHVVILHLERGSKRDKRLSNIIPYRFTETAEYTFCIPDDDPHIRSIELVEERSYDVTVRVRRDGRCKTRTIAAGLYELHVEHDGSALGATGKKAFIHVPRLKSSLQVGRSNSLQAGSGSLQAGSTPDSFSCDALSAFATHNGNFVINANGTLQAPSTGVDLSTGGWQMCRDSNGDYTFGLPHPGGAGYIYSLSAQSPAPGNLGVFTDLRHSYQLIDLGDFQFTMRWAYNSATYYPIVLGSDKLLHWTTGGAPEVFTIPIKYYQPGAAIPPLQTGEVALFHGCNYDNTHGTWVVRANLPDVNNIGYNSPFLGTRELLSQSTTNVSVRLGPETVASFYGLTGYRGPSLNIGEDTSCTDALSTFGSIKITPARDFIVATNRCANCNLSGVDLSGLDLSGGFFSGSTFVGANLANTDFELAVVESTNFSNTSTVLVGTNFIDAFLDSTNFRAADLSQANFQSTEGLLTTGFSKRPDLTGATLDLHTFLPSDWRWLNLDGAIINGVAGATLSTTANPLDLSGAVLNNVNLSSVILDGANLGCTSDPLDGSTVCTQLNHTTLTKASLRRVSLAHALLQGADLNSANLDGANLFAANLTGSETSQLSATLQGAFLRNVNLAQANLTGANLANANLYSTATATSCNSAAADGFLTSCASAVNAKLKNTVFTGAYLAGVDFSGSTPQSANFRDAYLAGSHFTNANLTQDTPTGLRTDFTGAWLQGATFNNANVTGAYFASAVVDLTHSRGATLPVQLSSDHLTFLNYTASGTPGCVAFTYSSATVVPTTDSSNICPDGNFGPCSMAQWQAVFPPAPPVCTLDFNWIFVTY